MARPQPPRSAQVLIDAKAARAVSRGHPWVWREAVLRVPANLPCGAAVRMTTVGGGAVGQALWDPTCPIALRVYSCREDRLSVNSLADLAKNAIAARDRLFDLNSNNALRLCNGEGDRLPGVVLDRYAQVLIVRLDGDAIRSWIEPLIEAIAGDLRDRGIATIALRGSDRASGLRTLGGEEPPSSLEVVEHGLRMRVDLEQGQKTGAFLDQRENRQRVRGLQCKGRVLNLFSYSGGFSVAAALAGASQVTSVDSAHNVHATAQRNFELNGLDPSQHSFVTADAFSFVQAAAERGERWDLVLSDPPSMAHNEKSVSRSLAAYRKLHAACARIVRPGGILCAASCSSHVTQEAFLETLDDEALGSGRFVVASVFGQPEDHPTVPGWPQGRYLKFVVLREQTQ